MIDIYFYNGTRVTGHNSLKHLHIVVLHIRFQQILTNFQMPITESAGKQVFFNYPPPPPPPPPSTLPPHCIVIFLSNINVFCLAINTTMTNKCTGYWLDSFIRTNPLARQSYLIKFISMATRK